PARLLSARDGSRLCVRRTARSDSYVAGFDYNFRASLREGGTMGSTMMTQAEKGRAFRALHERTGAFIIPNPWDVGTARILAHLGFEALATTSMGYAFSVGRLDNTVGRDETLAYASAIASATNLPVSADLENGFGDSPEIVAETVRLAAATGVVGCSIEDSTGRADHPIYEKEHAMERVRA